MVLRAQRSNLMDSSGAALLTVLVAMMIISIMLFEFQYAAMVERKLAYNDLNQLQAYYLAKSGVRIGLLRITLFGKAKRSPEIKNLAKNFPLDPYLDSIWNLPLPAFPPTGETVKKLEGTDKDSAEKALKVTKVTDGQSTHVITTEASKINLNFLEVPAAQRGRRFSFSDQPKTLYEYVGKLLINLMDNFLKESDNPNEEYPNLKPEEVVLNIMDWISPGSDRVNGGSKDSYYEQQDPPYKAKRGRFYTLDELRLVQGIDEHLFSKMKPYLTVFSYDGKININTATSTVLRALYLDFTDDDIKRIQEEKERLGGSWANEKQFVDFVTGPLNRNGFKNLYDNEKEYPFTVNSQSFLVESLGMVNKSASSVQRMIRVAVAFTTGKGGGVDPSVTNKAACDAKPGMAWYEYAGTPGRCITKPQDEKSCVDLAGQWTQENGQNCCKIPNTLNSCLTQADQQAAKDATALKVLYWNES